VKNTVGGRWRVELAFLCALIVSLGLGCSRRPEHPADAEEHLPGTFQAEKQPAIRAEQFFGKYVTTDYAWCSILPPEEPEATDRKHLWNEAAILPEVFAWRTIVILNPRYEIHHYPKLPEGNVPLGARRLLSSFYGAGTDREIITKLQVYEQGAEHPRCGVEVIDENTLWDTWHAPWLFEWRREGVGSNPIPLKHRALQGADR